jgi:2-iminobutanoate/2-iminopropanoate deaminase
MQMRPKVIKASDLPDPVMPYSQAVQLGNLISVSGQTGMDFRSVNISDDFEIQTRQAFENLSIVVPASGSSLRRAVKTTCRLRNSEHFELSNKLYAEYFRNDPPARSTPILDLPKPNLSIPIEAIAVVDE